MEIQWIWPITHYLLIHCVGQSTFAYIKLHIKLQSRQVKHTPKIALNKSILKNESISHCHNQSHIQICVPACIISSEFFMITPLYLVRLKNLWMDKIITRWLYYWGGHKAGFHCTNRFNLWVINSLMQSLGVHLTCPDCKNENICTWCCFKKGKPTLSLIFSM